MKGKEDKKFEDRSSELQSRTPIDWMENQNIAGGNINKTRGCRRPRPCLGPTAERKSDRESSHTNNAISSHREKTLTGTGDKFVLL